MARNEKKRQKTLMKKKKKDKERARKLSRTSYGPYGPVDSLRREEIIKKARDYPIYECMINQGWQEDGLARVLVSRRQPNEKLVLGTFLVDLYCLGLKNTFFNVDVTFDDYEDYVEENIFYQTTTLDLQPGQAYRIIYGAINYARELGFEPQKDFALSSFILDEPGTQDLSFEVEFGRDGKPLYVAGPGDNVNAVKRKLTLKLGEGNFNYIAPGNLSGDS